MADYTYNSDKWGSDTVALYNSVLKVVSTNEGPEPYTVVEVKNWTKIEQTVDDDELEELITTAREDLEAFTGIGFITRSLVVVINNADGGFHLPYSPITNDPTAVDANGNTIDLTYHLGMIEEPRGRMEVSYEAGYSALPKKFKTAIKEQVLFLYENRGESDIGLSPIAEHRMARYRTVV